MRLLWIALAAGLVLPGSAVAATPDHCPPQKAKVWKAAHKPRHHHRNHREEPRYYEDEYAPLPPPPPPHRPHARIWHDGYGKPYAVGSRPWAPPPPCPCPPDHHGGLPDFCRFNVWYGFDHHYGLESGL